MNIKFLQNHKGTILVDGKETTFEQLELNYLNTGKLDFVLKPKQESYKVVVNSWMCNNHESVFNTTWNNGVCMPAQIMFGNIIETKTTRYYMRLKTSDKKNTWEGWVAKLAVVSMEKEK